AGLHKTPFDPRIPSHYVSGVFVRVSLHSRGIGQSLMKYIEDYALNSGIRKLIILSSITARDFYLKNGYNPEDDGDGFNPANNTYMLTKQLT
ncbi:GNAT family N-acetyltransferase, partial [Thermodesulfobacteriota bacterium]